MEMGRRVREGCLTLWYLSYMLVKPGRLGCNEYLAIGWPCSGQEDQEPVHRGGKAWDVRAVGAEDLARGRGVGAEGGMSP